MKDLGQLPNKEGFKFITILKDGRKVKTKVIKDKNGLHSFVEFSNSIGWFPLNYR